MKARMKAVLSLALALALLLPLTGQMAVVPASAATQDQIDALRPVHCFLRVACFHDIIAFALQHHGEQFPDLRFIIP